jgi:predicted phosphodiesterase
MPKHSRPSESSNSMKIGILADIHGNGIAFERIYASLRKENCDLIFSLGDICGYYYDQNAIISILDDIPNLTALLGNHDAMFLDALHDEEASQKYCARYGRSFDFLKESITARSLRFLKNLPKKYVDEENGFAAYHGSPWDPMDEYIYPDSDWERFDQLPFSLVFLGHTHYPMDIRREKIRIINPGSAGQPRDGGWPSYAIYDDKKKSLSIKRVRFPLEALINDIRAKKENNPYLIDIFRRIRS